MKPVYPIIIALLFIAGCKKDAKQPDSPSGPPVITSISPTHGPKNALDTIMGSGFSSTPAANAVSFNGKPASVVNAGVDRLIVTIPERAGDGEVEDRQLLRGRSGFVDLDRAGLERVRDGNRHGLTRRNCERVRRGDDRRVERGAWVVLRHRAARTCRHAALSNVVRARHLNVVGVARAGAFDGEVENGGLLAGRSRLLDLDAAGRRRVEELVDRRAAGTDGDRDGLRHGRRQLVSGRRARFGDLARRS